MTSIQQRKGAALFVLFPILILTTPSKASEFMTPGEVRDRFESRQENRGSADAQAKLDLLPLLDEVITPPEQLSLDQEKATRSAAGPTQSRFDGVQPGVDLRIRDSKVDKQPDKTCTSYGLAGALENALDSENKINLSEKHLWSLYGKYSASAAIQAALANKITDEQYWPIGQSQPNAGYLEAARTQLKSAPALGGKIEEAVKALDRGHAVYIAMRVPADMSACSKVIGPDSRATHGGHALAVVGYQLDPQVLGGGYLILKNSWGAGCGDKGYQYLAFHNCERSDMYCKFWEIEAVERR